MKRIRNVAAAAFSATILLTMTGCETIRDYSVNSYQGVLPSGDLRTSGSFPLTTTTTAVAPAAGAEGATKPSDPAK